MPSKRREVMEPAYQLLEEPQPRIALRWVMTGLCFVGVALSLWSRTAESVAVIQWGEECNFTESRNKDVEAEQMQLSAFYYGYLISMLAGGWLSARFGGHVIFAAGVVGSCLASATTPLAGCHVGFAAGTRAAAGVCQGPVFPALSHLLGRWILSDERSTAVNWTNMGCYVGVLIAYPLSNWCCVHASWRWAYYVPALASLPWCVVWGLIASDRPQTSRCISAAELRLLEEVAPISSQPEIDYSELFGTGFVWVIALNIFAGNWVSYVFSMEIPQYLKDEGFGIGAAAGAIADLPPVSNMLFGLLVAYHADLLIRRRAYSVLTVRRVSNFLAIVPSSLLFIAVCYLPSSGDVGLWSRVGCLVVAAMLQAALNAGTNAIIYDVAPSTAGTICSFANSIGNLPGIAMPMLTAAFLEGPLGWSGLWRASAFVGLAAALAFHVFSTEEVLERRWLVAPSFTEVKKERGVARSPSGLGQSSGGSQAPGRPGSDSAPSDSSVPAAPV